MFYRLCVLMSFIGASFPLHACFQTGSAPVNALLGETLLGAGPRQVSIYNNLGLNMSTAPGTLAIYNSNNLSLLARLQQWPVAGGNIAAILAQPAVLDSNYDGIADAVYVVDATGLLWFVALNSGGFAVPVLIADFSALGYQFDQPLQLVQTQALEDNGQLQYQRTVILTASDGLQNTVVIAVKHRGQPARVHRLSDLIDRSSISAEEVRFGIDEQLWSELQQSAGWYVALSRPIITKPQVYAGVVYVLSAEAGSLNADCSLTAEAEPLLHALHLHHAGLIYAQRDQAVELQSAGALTLLKDQNGVLQLVLQNGQSTQLLLTELQSISAKCADCTDPLTAAQFPQLIRLATFQTEYGAH